MVWSLTRLIAAIENNVLVDFKWSRVGKLTEMTKIIDRYEDVKSFKRQLEISYEIESLISGERLNYLKTAILREAEIRLFNCDLKFEFYEKEPISINKARSL